DLIIVFGEDSGFRLNVAGRRRSDGNECGDAVAVRLDKPVAERAGHGVHQQDDFAVLLVEQAPDRFADKLTGDVVWWDCRAATGAWPVRDENAIIVGEKSVCPAWSAVRSGKVACAGDGATVEQDNLPIERLVREQLVVIERRGGGQKSRAILHV